MNWRNELASAYYSVGERHIWQGYLSEMGWARVDFDGLGVEGHAAGTPNFELAGGVCRFGVLAGSSVHLKGLAR